MTSSHEPWAAPDAAGLSIVLNMAAWAFPASAVYELFCVLRRMLQPRHLGPFIATAIFICLILTSGCSLDVQAGSQMRLPPAPEHKQDLASSPGMSTPDIHATSLDAKPLALDDSVFVSWPLVDMSLPAVPAGRAVVRWTEVTLPTYPLDDFQTTTFDAAFAWPYTAFDRQAYLAVELQPIPQLYRMIELENEYLSVSILPDLGGRIWQVRHKASGNTMFYQNQVVKPSPWGPVRQGGWFGLGGIEWNLPVVEHGYDWGTPWDVQTLEASDGAAQVIVSTPEDGRLVSATITVTLPADAAYIELAPTVHNSSPDALDFDYWQTAMLAPGPGNALSAELRFVLPADEMTVHSTGDETLPAPQARFSWPIYQDRDLSRLGNWTQYLGFFEYPQAHGPFTAVYDETFDAGAVHVFPAEVVQGSKVFGLGWTDALTSDYYTDDGSRYVELHSGLAPTFFEQTQLTGGDSVSWRERWYPISGMDALSYADAGGALYVGRDEGVDGETGVQVSFYPVRLMMADLVLSASATPDLELARRSIVASPVAPFQALLPVADLPEGPLTLRVEDRSGNPIVTFTTE